MSDLWALPLRRHLPRYGFLHALPLHRAAPVTALLTRARVMGLGDGEDCSGGRLRSSRACTLPYRTALPAPLYTMHAPMPPPCTAAPATCLCISHREENMKYRLPRYYRMVLLPATALPAYTRSYLSCLSFSLPTMLRRSALRKLCLLLLTAFLQRRLHAFLNGRRETVLFSNIPGGGPGLYLFSIWALFFAAGLGPFRAVLPLPGRQR